ncbi:integration host factor subunit beta [bacterium]|nr:integration host factor subunit beta [bacterium]
MTKRELIEEVVHARTDLPRREVEALVNGVFETLSDALARGERIEIRGFGSFIVKRRNAREGLNPKTGQVVAVHAKRVAFFKAGKELKQRVDSRPIDEAADGAVRGVEPERARTPSRKPASATPEVGRAAYGMAAAGGDE